MRIINLLLLIHELHIISSKEVDTEYAECQFSVDFNSLYTCSLIFANITQANIKLSILGNHSESKTDKDVKVIDTKYSQDVIIQTFDPQLIEKYDSLEFLRLDLVMMQKFGKNSLKKCSTIIYISLSLNLIESIPNKLFENCKSLKYLDLSYNFIAEIANNDLRGLENLEVLRIQFNLVNLTVSKSSFDGLKSLKTLELTHFNVKGSDQLQIFSHMELLESISLSLFDATFEHLKNMIGELRNLRYIALPLNFLCDIDFDFLSKFPTEILILASNRINVIEPNSLINFSNLTKLDISYNYIKKFPSKVFAGLESLQELDISGNGIKRIEDDSFDDLVSLTYLDLSHNNLTFLIPRYFKKLVMLEILILNENSLSFFEQELFSDMKSLKYLLFNWNEVKVLDSLSFCDLENLTLIEAASNQIEAIDEDFFDKLPSLDMFDGRNNACCNQRIRNFTNINVTEHFHECFDNWNILMLPPDEETKMPPVMTTPENEGSALSVSVIVIGMNIFVLIYKLV